MAIADQLSRLNELRQNLADTLTAKNVEAAETEGFETLVPKVEMVETGVQLPELTNPASATDILLGKQAINAAGEVVEGEYTPPTPRHLNVGLGKITAGDSISYILPDKDMLLVETSYNAATSEWNYVVYKVENGTITRESMFHGGRVSFTRQSNGLKFYVYNTTSKEIRGITIWAYVKE